MQVILPDGFTLLSGDLQWQGGILKNDSKTIKSTIKAVKAGDWKIKAWANIQLRDGSFGKADILYINTSETSANVSKYLNLNASEIAYLVPDSSYNQKSEIVQQSYTGNYVVKGRFVYNDRNNNPQPIRWATVELYDNEWWGLEYLGQRKNTDSNGNYAFDSIDNNDGLFENGRDIVVILKAETDAVYIVGQNGNTYTFQVGPCGDVGGTNCPVVNGVFNVGEQSVPNEQRGVYNIFSVIQDGYGYVDGLPNTNAPSKTKVQWYPGFDGKHTTGHSGTHVDPGTSNMFIQGIETDPDEWDNDIILHEYGHVIMNQYAEYIPNSGGDHSWSNHISDRLAYSEGWGHFFSSAKRNSPTQTDTYLGGSSVLNLETPTGGVTGSDNEGAVAAILWDIFDSNNDGRDTISMGINGIWDVFRNYDPDTSSTSHNHPWTIHEFWNGWFARNLGNKPQMKAVYFEHGIDKNSNPSVTISTPSPFWQRGTITITATASDPDSEDTITVTFKKSRDGSTWPDDNFDSDSTSPYSASLDTSAIFIDDSVWVKAVASDGIESSESTSSSFGIDNAPPSSTISWPTPNAWYSSSSLTAQFSGNDITVGREWSGVKGFYYKMDSNPYNWEPYGSGGAKYKPYTLSDGLHTFYVYAVDNAGNTETPIESVAFGIDSTPPSAPTAILWSDGTYSTDTTLVADWSDVSDTSNVVDYYLQVDVDSTDFSSGMIYNGWIGSSTSSKTLTSANGIADGHKYYYRVYAKNGAGLSGSWSAISSGVTVDTIISVPIGLIANPSSWTVTNSFTVSWSNPSDFTGIIGAYYKKDSPPTSNTDGTYIAGSGITQITGITVSGDGSHPIYVWLKDSAGNINFNNRASTTINLDASPPSTLSVFINSGAAYTSSNTVTLTLSATEPYSTPIQMSFSNDKVSWSTWEPFSNTKSGWSLSGYGGNSNDGTKTVYFKAKDALSNEVTNANAASDTIILDTQPPQTTISPASSDTVWRNSNSVTLTASDASEIAATYYKINNGVQQTYSSTFTLPDGINTVEYWSVDNAGRTETPKAATIKVDTVPPITAISPVSSNTWYTTSQVITLTPSADTSNIAGTYYKIDNGAQQTYTLPFTAHEGNHTYTYWSMDNAGNIETAKVATIKVDTVPPAITLREPTSSNFIFARKGQMIYVNSTFTELNPSVLKIDVFKGVTNIGSATINTLSGGTDVLRSDTVTLSSSASDDAYDLRINLTDLAGNIPDVKIESGAVRIDSVSPTISAITLNKTIAKNGESIRINVSASDNNGIASVTADGSSLSLSGGFWTGISSVAGSEGVHTVSVVASDAAGNSITNTTKSYIIDNTPPVALITSPNNNDVVKGTVVISGSVTDTYWLSSTLAVDDLIVSTSLPYSWNTNSETETAHTIRLTGTDQAGNTNTSQISIIVDRTDPIISLDSPTTSNYVYGHAGGNIIVNYTYTEANPANVSIMIYNQTATLASKIITSLAGGANIAGSEALTLSNTASDGSYNIKVEIKDKANNNPVSSLQVNALRIDNTPPKISIIGLNRIYVKGGAAINVNVSASDNIAIFKVTANGSLLNNISDYWTGIIDANSSEGDHSVEVIAYDEAGNMDTNGTQHYTVDNTPPTVTNLSLSAVIVKINESINISLNSRDIIVGNRKIWTNISSKILPGSS